MLEGFARKVAHAESPPLANALVGLSPVSANIEAVPPNIGRIRNDDRNFEPCHAAIPRDLPCSVFLVCV